MTRPRLRISQVMLLVVILAGDCVLAREMAQVLGPSAFAEWCLVVILPMVNIVAVATYRLATLKEPGSRAFWLGFVSLGGAALLASSLLTWFSPDVAGYPIRATIYPVFVGLGSSASLKPIFPILAGGLVMLPHLLVAIGGGLALRRFRPAALSVG